MQVKIELLSDAGKKASETVTATLTASNSGTFKNKEEILFHRLETARIAYLRIIRADGRAEINRLSFTQIAEEGFSAVFRQGQFVTRLRCNDLLCFD